MRQKLLRSAVLLALASASPSAPQAEPLDYDPALYAATRGFPDRDPVRVRYGDPDDYGTKLRVYRERQYAAQRFERARREAELRVEEQLERAEAQERRDYFRARRQLRAAEREFHRALAFGDRTVIRYKRHHLARARRMLRRAASRVF